MLDSYLQQLRQRWRLRAFSRLLAWITALLLLMTIGATWILRNQVPGAEQLAIVRTVLLAFLLVMTMVQVRRLAGADVIAQAERQVPAFAGRLRTLTDARGREDNSPLLPLLAGECAQIAQAHPPGELIPRRQWLQPLLVAVLAVAALAVTFSPVTGNWAGAAQRLWFGNLFSAGQPQILVTPGNALVPYGLDVVVEARTSGFSADEMQIHARVDDASGWQQANMSRYGDDHYGFVLVGAGQDMDYYLKTGSVTSERFRIRVVELPVLSELDVQVFYPEWTGQTEPVSVDGDIRALAGSRVAVSAVLDEADAEAFVVVNDEVQALPGGSEAVEFRVSEPGSWYLAVNHEGELARISDTFSIELIDDAPPEIVYVWPGRDRQATAIEEVVVEFAASDDFGVDALELNYSVNGARWQQVVLDPDSGRYILALEDVGKAADETLAPGDVISLYAQARDHSQTTRSDLYFVDVRPFDRRYRESQQSAGNQGGGGDDLDIAERQREILTATWNLLNKQSDADAEAVDREAGVVAMLQNKLREQVTVLIERASARSLDQDQAVARFVEALQQAAAEMAPAAAYLEAREISAAVVPEQRALAQLRAAEASVRDISVSMADSSRGRGTLADSLSELVDLEMDRERNRYETPQSLNPGDETRTDSSEWQQLEELAAREEQAARQRAQSQDDLASRWQQAQLQRELEALRQELQNRQRSGAGVNQASLQEAISSLRDAEESLQRERLDPQSSRQLGEQLRQAADALRQDQLDGLQQRLADTQQQAQALLQTQDQIMERLEAIQQRSLADSVTRDVNPWEDFSMEADAGTKRRMREDLQSLRQDLTEAVAALTGEPDTAQLLQQALTDLDAARVDERLANSADAFEYGRPLFTLGHEETVHSALVRLDEQLRTARESFGAAGDQGETNGVQQTTRGLRQALAAARDGEGIDVTAVEAVARQVQALRRQQQNALAGTSAADRQRYQPLGLNTEDPEALYQLVEASVDLLEAALQAEETTLVQAPASRDQARDSAAAAEYFRRLSQDTKP
jgi:hypothetical protein